MRRGSIVTLALSALALPAMAIAAYTVPSDLLKATQNLGKPMDVSYEAHAKVEGVDMAMWLKGSAEGKSVATAKADMRMTVHAASPEEGTMEVKVSARVLKQTLYVRLDSVKGTMAASDLSEVRQYLGKWYSVRIPDEDEQQETLGLDREELQQLVWDAVDSILSMNRTGGVGGGSTYSLKLKRTAWKDIVPVIREFSAKQGEEVPEPTNRDLAEMRKIFNKMNLHIKVMTDANDVFTGMKFYAAINDMDISFVLQGTTALRAMGVSVTAPKGAESLDDLLNPTKQLGDARNAQRRSDINTILNAVYQYAIDNNGELPEGIPTGTPKEICDSRGVRCAGMVDLNVLTGNYLVVIPSDPQDGDGLGTNYWIHQDTNGRITVSAPGAESDVEISVTR